MALTLRVRHRDGSVTLPQVSAEATVADLQNLIESATGVPLPRQVLKYGTPPVRLSSDLGHAVKLSEVGIRNRDTVTIEDCDPNSSSQSCVADAAETENLGGAATVPTTRVGKSAGAAKKRARDEAHSTSQATEPCDGSGDLRARELLPAFDRAIAAATKHAAMLPEDKHQVWALRKGKTAVIESLKRGDNISLSALHTLTGVGHWVVQQVKEHVNQPSGPAAKRQAPAQKGAPAPTPSDFKWWYLGRDGKPVEFRNDAEMSISPTGPIFRVAITHASGRREKAWLPDAKAPPQCAKADQL